MKRFIVFLLFCSSYIAVPAQVGIGTSTPDASAQLEVKSNTRGLLVPRTSTSSRMAIINPAKGLLLFDTTTRSFWFHDGTSWVEALHGKNGWMTGGNNNTVDGVNYIGTSDNIPLNLRVNNEAAGRIDHNNGNSFFGHQAGNNITTGQYNTAIGEQTLFTNQKASFNTGVGTAALQFDTGYFNTAVGFQSLFANAGGNNNTAIGAQSLTTNQSGTENSAAGYNSLNRNTTGNYNAVLGSYSLYSNTSGSYNTAAGYQSLLSNTTGANNVALGVNSLFLNHTGSRNIAVGQGALLFNFGGNENVAIGDSALYKYSPAGTGTPAVAVGSKALYNNTTGQYNTAIGARALYTNTTGYQNISVGNDALYNNLAGTDNVALGYRAMYTNTNGSVNIGIGTNALESNTTGIENVGIGYGALQGITTVSGNIAIGYQALPVTLTGNGNIGIGTFAAIQGSSANNTVIGTNAGVFSGFDYATALGSGAAANCSNCLILGGDDVFDRTRVGINLKAPLADLHIVQQSDNVFDVSRGIRVQRPNGNQWRTFIDPGNNYVIQYNNALFSYIEPVGGTFISNSDERLKKDIKPVENVLDKLLLLNPKTYHYTLNKDTDRRLYGFVAQEVEQQFPDFVYTNEAGFKGVGYSNFGVVAIKGIQEQQAEINDLKNKNKTQQEQIDALLKRIEALEAVKKQ